MVRFAQGDREGAGGRQEGLRVTGLVHLYHMVPDDELSIIVQNNIPDLLRFVREISLYLEKNGGAGVS